MGITGLIIDVKLLLITGLIIWSLIRIIIYNKNRKLSLKKEIIYIAFIIYILCLIGITLLPIVISFVPNDYEIRSVINLNLFDFINSYNDTTKLIFFKEIVGNLLLLTPLGIFLPIIWNKKFSNLKIITLAGFLVSFTIELGQYFEVILGLTRGGRVSDIADLTFNTISIILGYMIFKILFNEKKFIL
ncbi:VanZ family protein [Clostridium sporogenes]